MIYEGLEANVTVESNAIRGGLNLFFDQPGVRLISPLWEVGGWQIRFLSLPADETIDFGNTPGSVYIKVICGNMDAGSKTQFPQKGTVRSTQFTGSTATAVTDVLIAVVIKTDTAPEKYEAMSEFRLKGPQTDAMPFRSFDSLYTAVTDAYKGMEAYITPGLHLLDATGDEIVNVTFWTAAKGADLLVHNHGYDPSEKVPEFAEVHLVLNNGTGMGGMYKCSSDQPQEPIRWLLTDKPKTRTPMQCGEEHGPFFDIDNGKPVLRDNGALAYPWHSWEAGINDEPEEAFDFVMAFEISLDYIEL